jgi:hypothetical protein
MAVDGPGPSLYDPFMVIHETADAVAAGEGHERALTSMRWTL